MAKKSKKPHTRNKHKPLATHVKESGFKGKVMSAPGGMVKMSDIIIQFIEPYNDLAQTYEAQMKLITVAIIAWNASLLPEDRGKAMIDKVLVNLPLAERGQTMDVIRQFMERKKRYFADYKRPVVDYQLTEDKDEFHLSVASLASIDEMESFKPKQ